MILLSYFETIISRDVSDRFKIREREKIKSLAKYYLTNISSPITFNSIAKFLNLPVKTVERFSGFLETACLVFFIKRFSFSVKDQEKSARKVYSIDQGLSNAIGFRFTEKPGRVMENIVAVELRRRQTMNPSLEVYYWKDNYAGEVDFVLKNNLKIESLIQVCHNLDDPATKNRELKPLLKAMEDLKIKEAVVVTDEFEAEEKYGKNKIIYIPLWKWLLT